MFVFFDLGVEIFFEKCEGHNQWAWFWSKAWGTCCIPALAVEGNFMQSQSPFSLHFSCWQKKITLNTLLTCTFIPWPVLLRFRIGERHTFRLLIGLKIVFLRNGNYAGSEMCFKLPCYMLMMMLRNFFQK